MTKSALGNIQRSRVLCSSESYCQNSSTIVIYVHCKRGRCYRDKTLVDKNSFLGINPFSTNVPLLYPLKTSECFQGVKR